MKKLLTLALLLGLAFVKDEGQTASYSYQLPQLIVTTPTAGTGGRIIGTGAQYHQLSWNVSGTITTCSVRVDSSADGVTWNTGDVIGATTCTSNGNTLSTALTVNYVRINVVTLTGGGTVTALLTGYANNPTGGGGGGGSSTGSPVSFSVLSYSGVPDGSTNNATAITNLFAATNAVTNGIPTAYFPCSSAGCQYNLNAGSGVSPFNPLIPTTIKCDPGVIINFTGGTAHGLDLGPTNLIASTAQAKAGYTIQGCRFIGGANLTEGIYLNPFVANVEIADVSFLDFMGATSTAFAIWAQSENWSLRVHDTYYWREDLVNGNFLKINNVSASVNNEFYLGPNNTVICVTADNSTVQNCGVGMWVDGIGVIESNNMAGMVPSIRVASHSGGTHIYDNIIEVDPGNLTGGINGIEFGNPASSDTVAGVEVHDNTFYVGTATDYAVGYNNTNNVANKWYVHHNFLRTGSLGTVLMHENTAGTNFVKDNYGAWTAWRNVVPTSPIGQWTGLGTSPGQNPTMNAGSTEFAGSIIISTGTSPAASGTGGLTFPNTSPYITTPSCVMWLQNGGASWNAQASVVATGGTATTRTFNWSNNGVALTGGTNNAYVINYQCSGY